MYKCLFKLNETHCTICVYVDCLENIINGFWINNEYEFTKGSDSLWYIMPHMIKLIKKEVNEIV